MKKFILLLLLFVGLGASTTAYAGTINSYEQEVISAAQGTFEYQGNDYKLDSSYAKQLYDYLSGDDVDFTAADRDTVLRSIQGNIEAGVKEGYLKPVNPSSGQNNTQDNGVDADTFDYKDESNLDTPEESKDDMLEDWFTDLDKPDNSTISSDQTDTADIDVDSDNKAALSTSDPTEDNTTKQSIIKNTGFDLSLTLAMAALIGVIMLAGICVTIRYHYFAQYDE